MSYTPPPDEPTGQAAPYPPFPPASPRRDRRGGVELEGRVMFGVIAAMLAAILTVQVRNAGNIVDAKNNADRWYSARVCVELLTPEQRTLAEFAKCGLLEFGPAGSGRGPR